MARHSQCLRSCDRSEQVPTQPNCLSLEAESDAQTCVHTSLALLLGVFTLLAVGAPAQAAPVTVTNGTQFTDTTGAVVHAHGGEVIKVGSYHYSFGENRNTDNTR